MQDKRAIQRRIVTFVFITFLLNSIFQLLIYFLKPTSVGREYYDMGTFWSPGSAALITCYLERKSLAELGWNWGNWRYYLGSYTIPLIYSLVAYMATWISGLGAFFNTDFVQATAKSFGWNFLPDGLVIVFYVLFSGTYGLLQDFLPALGEEIGWRGFLVPELAKTTTFLKTAMISGSVWAMWHYPFIIFGNYNGGTPLLYSLVCFTLTIIGISFPLAWLRIKSGNLWTGMVFHASHNVFIQNIFNPLTQDTGITKYIISEFGISIAIASLIVAYIFWKYRAQGQRI